jgi:aspartokinase/homoserine dehydrogenase 1
MQVLKFGGSSVANAENIEKVAKVIEQKSTEDTTVVVVSALGGITDTLLDCGNLASEGNDDYKEKLKAAEQRHIDVAKALMPVVHQSRSISNIKQQFNEIEDICKGVALLRELSTATKDRLAGFGELLSSQIITERLISGNSDAAWKDAREIITTDSNYTFATVDFDTTNKRIKDYFEKSRHLITIVPGFIAANHTGKPTTLGRGGSDYTAAIIAAALNANKVEIWTDVSGMMTADPRLVTAAKNIKRISYQEAMELSHFGAKVIYPPTILPVMKKGIPAWIKNTFEPEAEGTLIENVSSRIMKILSEAFPVLIMSVTNLEGTGMVGIPGFSKRLFEALASTKVNVILITQASSEHSICVGIEAKNMDVAKNAIDEAFSHEMTIGILDPLVVEKDLSIVALVGDNMKNHPGISGKMFGALGRNGINVRAIAQGSSEKNISTVISRNDVKKAINVLHEEFFETTYKRIHLFIIGVGNVGSRLLAQINQQLGYLEEHLLLQIRVAGIANSKKMLFNDDGINLLNWQKALLESGEQMNMEEFIKNIQSKNLRNAVFADVTANKDIATTYDSLLQKSVAVVACNKIACSSKMDYYKKLKQLSKEFNAPFLFETNVGAGLPVIGTLNDLLRSGDSVNKIQAVLSGTLNFVFNNYNGTRPFADVVRQAQDEGYTEPDPRLDLSGMDVMRKIMILAREAGEKLEMEDITNNSFMPESCMQGSVENFYDEMKKHEEHFKKLYEAAHDAGSKLKFVASFDEGKASVGLQQIPPQHDLYHLYGKDNVVLFYTSRYVQQPLVIKGAGAGADVTASGLFADIIRAGR